MSLFIKKHARLSPEQSDGFRVLVTRYWLRGLKRTSVDEWIKDLAPSKELLAEYTEFTKSPSNILSTDQYHDHWSQKYRREMAEQKDLVLVLARRHLAGKVITLLCACHDTKYCHRTLLAQLIEEAAQGIKENE